MGVAAKVVAVPAAAASTEGVGRWTQPNVGPALPVSAVVLGFKAGLCEVGDFVVDVSGGVELVAQYVVLPCALLVIGLYIFAVFQTVRQHAVSLHRKLIAGDVLRVQRQGIVNGALPNAVFQVG